MGPASPLPETPQVVDGPAAWLAADLEATDDWRHTFTDDDITALDTGLSAARRHSPDLDLATITAAVFPLADSLPLLEYIRTQLIDGHGVMVLDGFPVDRYSHQELRTIWWGLGVNLGSPSSQSWRGDLMGDVRDLGTGISGPTGRGYTSNSELNFHSDQADATALFFLRRAKEGGVTRLASSVAVHNEIIRRDPAVMKLLYEPVPTSWQSNQPEGERGWYLQPVFGRHDHDVACAYVRTNVTLAEQNAEAPALTPKQLAAVDYVQAVAAEPQFSIERLLDSGSMVFVNNHTAFHMRTEFVDHDDPVMKRHLLRLWLSLPNSRRLPDTFRPFFGDTAAGAVRGGYQSRDGELRFETAPAR